jgi:hypothetical protein
MMLVSFNSNTKGNNSGAGTAYPSGYVRKHVEKSEQPTDFKLEDF